MDKKNAQELLEFVAESIEIIKKRMVPIKSIDDFLDTEEGQEKLDSILMRIQSIGEATKNLNKRYNVLLENYKDAAYWSQIIKTREVISHHYIDINAEIVFDIATHKLDDLYSVVNTILEKEFSGN
ncbi:MAG: hypothetical protein A2023_00400 [Sulfuricurvum sp. GWF2_44_89]|uniref:Antitoxin n=1 Tax=Sulfuricurvum kujiense TaxID=148813 RepID=A0A2D3W9H3_9BACT|nr:MULTISPECIES: HepT-like ribonuclease domain-containing protein [Sulfuricurvum]OHD77988.1 MAG: hypothetical protein A2023_00400 [Sulfuricurvum sp. GWF2_44_89]OHD92309.1 MAG: hypothetical protein A2552_10390 [Sulfuricurvum sp. RIFOXYD2_FULL_44_160]DAB37972.1 MAG TPA: hypothetical protein CFH83_08430 [Sulfuricurvum kujiense]